MEEIAIIQPPSLSADFDNDLDVDAGDLAQWRGDFGEDGGSDADNDGDSDGADFLKWQQQFGSGSASVSSVPEPASFVGCLACSWLLLFRRKVAAC